MLDLFYQEFQRNWVLGHLVRETTSGTNTKYLSTFMIQYLRFECMFLSNTIALRFRKILNRINSIQKCTNSLDAWLAFKRRMVETKSAVYYINCNIHFYPSKLRRGRGEMLKVKTQKCVFNAFFLLQRNIFLRGSRLCWGIEWKNPQ